MTLSIAQTIHNSPMLSKMLLSVLIFHMKLKHFLINLQGVSSLNEEIVSLENFIDETMTNIFIE